MELLSIELVISIVAIVVALYSAFIQRKKLAMQNIELKKSAEANEKAQQALNDQNRLQSLAALLQAQIHLHDFNNRRGVNEKMQKIFAIENFKKIKEISEEIKEITSKIN